MNNGTKKFFLWTALCGFLASIHVSYALQEGNASLGVHAGVSVANLSAPSGISTSNIAGIAAGVNMDIPLTPSLYLSPEATFVQRGSNITDIGGTRLNVRYESIEVPVFLKVKLGEGARPYFFAGPQANFNLSSRISTETAGSSSSVTFRSRAIEFGGAAGLGVEVSNFLANVRYQISFTEVNDTSASWRSQGFLALLGFRI